MIKEKGKKSEWSNYMKKTEVEGIADTSKSIPNKNGIIHPYDFSVKYLLYNTVVYLRRKFYNS